MRYQNLILYGLYSLLFSFTWTGSILAADVTPVIQGRDDWKPLYELVDADLQADLTEILDRNPKWKQLIDKKRLAVGVVDMSSSPPRFARINGNVMMYAASLPKIAILFASYVSFEDGSLQETPEIHADLTAMIRVSSNEAATRSLNRIGMQKVEKVLEDPQYGFYDESRGEDFGSARPMRRRADVWGIR